MKYEEVYGDLITMAQEWKFDVIAHGVNCQNIQKKGLAPLMVAAFNTDKFHLEQSIYKGDINKLGQIDHTFISSGGNMLIVVNCYIQYNIASEIDRKPLSYHALKLCLLKINHKFKGKHIGLPGWIGGGYAGGNADIIKHLIEKTLVDCDVTVVKLKEYEKQDRATLNESN